MVLTILCVDGLDPDFASENGFSMPYERRLTIPRALYHPLSSQPWTLHVWGSIFCGRIEKYPLIAGDGVKTGKLKRVLKKKFGNSDNVIAMRFLKMISPDYKFMRLRPVIKESVFTNYKSFKYHIPAISYDFFYSGDDDYDECEILTFEILARNPIKMYFDIYALYCRKIDHLGHRLIGDKGKGALKHGYFRVFQIANSINVGDVILISDHGTMKYHTDNSYFGCNRPIFANDVLEVRKDIERIAGVGGP